MILNVFRNETIQWSGVSGVLNGFWTAEVYSTDRLSDITDEKREFVVGFSEVFSVFSC